MTMQDDHFFHDFISDDFYPRKVVTPVIFSKFKLNEETNTFPYTFAIKFFSSFSGPKIVILSVKIETFDQGRQFGTYC